MLGQYVPESRFSQTRIVLKHRVITGDKEEGKKILTCHLQLWWFLRFRWKLLRWCRRGCLRSYSTAPLYGSRWIYRFVHSMAWFLWSSQNFFLISLLRNNNNEWVKSGYVASALMFHFLLVSEQLKLWMQPCLLKYSRVNFVSFCKNTKSKCRRKAKERRTKTSTVI